MGVRQHWWFCFVIGALGCSGPASPAAAGERCFRAEDCAAGLVCIERACSSDLTPIAPESAAASAADERQDAENEPAPAGDAGL